MLIVMYLGEPQFTCYTAKHANRYISQSKSAHPEYYSVKWVPSSKLSLNPPVELLDAILNFLSVLVRHGTGHTDYPKMYVRLVWALLYHSPFEDILYRIIEEATWGGFIDEEYEYRPTAEVLAGYKKNMEVGDYGI